MSNHDNRQALRDLQRKRAFAEQQRRLNQQGAGAAPETVESKNLATEKPEGIPVDGEAPEILPQMCEIVVLTWGDPQLIDSPLIDIPLIITSANSAGRVNGQMVTDPSMIMQGPGGRPMAVPPLAPIGNVPYSRERKALTWRWSARQQHLFDMMAGWAKTLDEISAAMATLGIAPPPAEASTEPVVEEVQVRVDPAVDELLRVDPTPTPAEPFPAPVEPEQASTEPEPEKPAKPKRVRKPALKLVE